MKTPVISFGPGSSAYGMATGVEITGIVTCDGVSQEMVVMFPSCVLDEAEIDVNEMLRMVRADRPIRFEWDGITGPDAPAGADGTLMVPSIVAGTMVDYDPIGADITEADAPRIAGIIAADISSRFGHKAEAKPGRWLKGTRRSISFRMAIEQDHGVMDMLPLDTHLVVSASNAGNRTDVSVSLRLKSRHMGSATFWIGRWTLCRDRIVKFEPAQPLPGRPGRKKAA